MVKKEANYENSRENKDSDSSKLEKAVSVIEKIGIISLGIGIGYGLYVMACHNYEKICQNIPNTTQELAEYIYSHL